MFSNFFVEYISINKNKKTSNDQIRFFINKYFSFFLLNKTNFIHIREERSCYLSLNQKYKKLQLLNSKIEDCIREVEAIL